MHKISIAIVACIVLFSLPLLPLMATGEETMGLTKQQLEEYNESKLTVTAYALVSSAGGAAPATANPASRLWTATYGYQWIPEWEFLRIVGYPEEAQKARKQKRTVNIFSWGGMGVALLGLVLMMPPVISWDGDDAGSPTKSPLFWGGAGGITLGFGSIIYAMFLPSGNITPVGKAYTMAEEYNSTLVQSIKEH